MEIGGYFSLELNKGMHYHTNALRLNTGRNCFEFILKARGYKKIYIPYYTCDVLLEPLKKLHIAYSFYNIDINFEPIEYFPLNTNEAFLYINYFGLKQKYVEHLANIYGSNLIVDNTQAFYAEALDGLDTFYSARKFFGVSDGAYLYTNISSNEKFSQDYSYNKMLHLLRRIDCSAEEGYAEFRNNEDNLMNNPILKMSKLTEQILCSIDYKSVKQKRRENYTYLNETLGDINILKLPSITDNTVPLVYPFLTSVSDLRNRLIKNKVYVTTFWLNVLDWTDINDIENQFTKCLIPLPIDQRYGIEEMNKVLSIISYGSK